MLCDLHAELHRELGLTLFEWYAIADPDIDRAGDPDEWQQQAAHLYLELERLSGRASPTFWQRRSQRYRATILIEEANELAKDHLDLVDRLIRRVPIRSA